jgi:hypothetical protein
MGDCRIKLLIFQQFSECLEETVQIFASDASLREVRDFIFDDSTALWNEEMTCTRIWDCTLHPPKDITGWLFEDFPDYSGPRAKTLFDAGCFPSSTWQILPLDMNPIVRSVHEDTQYNVLNNVQLSTESKVDLILDNRVVNKTPSQILNEVMTRDKEENSNKTDSGKFLQYQNHAERRKKEAARHAQLESRIQSLSSIASSTSLQVRTMLIKNRCTGDSNLAAEDRVYFHISLVSSDNDHDDVTEHFRFFSRLDTISKVIQCFAPIPPKSAEFLVYTTSSTLRRLPILLRLSEAIEKSYVKQTTSVIIRWFTPGLLEPTSSILDDPSIEDHPSNSKASSGIALVENTIVGNQSQLNLNIDKAKLSTMRNEMEQPSQEICDKIKAAVYELDSKNRGKKSATSLKVRQMTMKGKAKGDVKRTPDIKQRFFLEIILLEESLTKGMAVFMGRKDTVDRLIKEHAHVESPTQVFSFLESGSITIVPSNLTFEELEKKGIVRCFDRLFISKPLCI